ncbi:hypothetical protein OS493_012772 [Desmophyllum pertusum]|uniref:Uncharacterized protein n=1 Tax=Desmophyllum pertusum TaxID=174260 RepID=A0A9X0CYA5_9CNID|nr:hypothetical protein OS493_012772 [Desmophyllum pertusum]
MARNYGFEDFPGEDQTVEGDYIDELIRKYLYSEDMNSFYEDTSVPLLASPEADKWPGDGGDVILPEFMNYSQDCLVPELFLLENIDDLPEKYDEVEPEEELLSILEEIITEDERKTEGSIESSTETSHVDTILTSGQITNSIDPKTLNQETKSQKRKRPKRASTDKNNKDDKEKKGKRACRQPIIMKSRAKRRDIEE